VIDPVINPALALYSDRLFMAAVGVYLLAMVLHAAEYAMARSAREPALVGATPALVGAPADGPGDVDALGAADGFGVDDARAEASAGPRPPADRSRADRLGGAAVNLVVLAAALQLGAVVTRGLATGRWPLGYMYEFT
jgi:nitroreductase